MRLSRSSIPILTSVIVVTVAALRVAGSISTAAALGAGVFSETAVVAAGGMAGESRVDEEKKNGDEDEWRRWSCRLWRFFSVWRGEGGGDFKRKICTALSPG